MKKLLTFLGCTPNYKNEIVGFGHHVIGQYSVTINSIPKTYRVFGLKVWTKKY